jgi:pimeloyl-ACP methyl ester carboxylesterase
VTVLQAQLKVLRRWGSKAPADLSQIHQPVLVANGESDRMVPTKNTRDLARRIPNSDLIIYPDAGHGGVVELITRRGVSVLLGRTRPNRFPSVLDRPLRHLSV